MTKGAIDYLPGPTNGMKIYHKEEKKDTHTAENARELDVPYKER
jgi:hypothetical protein